MNPVLEGIAAGLAGANKGTPVTSATETTPGVAAPAAKPVEEAKPPAVEVKAPESSTPTEPEDKEFAAHLNWLTSEEDANVQTTAAAPESGAPSGQAEAGQAEAQYAEKAKAYDSLVSNPLFNAVVEMMNSGKGVADFAKEMYFDDWSGKSPAEVYEATLRSEGVSAEDIEAEMSKFSELTAYQQKKQADEIRAARSSEYEKKIEKFKNPATDYTEIQRVQVQAAETARKELTDTLKEMDGKYYYGLKITPEIASEIEAHVVKNAVPNEDGRSYNIKQSIRNAVFNNERLIKKLLRANADAAMTAGYKKAIEARNRPSKEDTNGAPVNAATLSETIRAIGERKWGK
jgi:hypothetical protein